MGATQNIQNPFPQPDNLTQDFLIPYAFAGIGINVSVGDLVYYKGTISTALGGDVAYPAEQLASLGSEALDQIQFAKLFLGVSQQKVLSAETNATKRFTVRVEGPVLAKCPSQAWKVGDLVGVYSNGVTLDAQQVDKVTQRALAIGVCINESSVAATTVQFEMESRYGNNIMGALPFASLGEQDRGDQMAPAARVLSSRDRGGAR